MHCIIHNNIITNKQKYTMSANTAIVSQSQEDEKESETTTTSISPDPKRQRTNQTLVTPDKPRVENPKKTDPKSFYVVLIEGKPGKVFNKQQDAFAHLSKNSAGTKTSFITTPTKTEGTGIVKEHLKNSID